MKNEGIKGKKNPKNRDNKLYKWRHRRNIDKWREYATDNKGLESRNRS